MDKNKEFEKLWKDNKYDLLKKDPEYNQITNSYKISSGSDLILFGLPVVIGIVFMDYCKIEKELLKWLACAGITILSFVICVFIKSLFSNNKSITEVEDRIKNEYHEKYNKSGKLL
jgi:hypothetical protein